MALRFFVCGPPRSGTSTIHHALTRAGVRSVHGSVPESDMPLAILLHRAFLEDRDPLFYISHGVEAISDAHITRSPKWSGDTLWPVFYPRLLGQIRLHHPEAWIVLNTRPTEEWIDSLNRWKDLRARIVKADLPFLPGGEGKTDEELGMWIEGYYQRVRTMFEKDHKFVEFDINDPDAKDILAGRTGMEFPWWGKRNVGLTGEDLRVDRKRQAEKAAVLRAKAERNG